MAELVPWNDKLSVGVQSVDSQHKRLIGMVNRLHDAMQTGQGSSVMGPLLDELINYTASHFKHEEGLMAKHAYPEFPNHKQQHDNLVKTVVELQTKFKAGQTRISIDVLRFLKTWLTDHIMVTDKALGAFCTAQGVA